MSAMNQCNKKKSDSLRFYSVLSILFVLVHIPAYSDEPPETILHGIWENSSRFVEFSPEGKMRIVLKPYYAFVYEDAGWIPCSVSACDTGGAGDGVFTCSVLYPGEKSPSVFSVAVLSGGTGGGAPPGIFTRFYVRDVPDGGAGLTGTESGDSMFSGFWICTGNTDSIMLYRSGPDSSFFCFYFDGRRYYKIRYWLTDARFRDVRAVFAPDPAKPDKILSVPKFLFVDGSLYTCVTGTGGTLRNYESGNWELAGDNISMTADKPVYAGEKMTVTVPFRFSADGTVLAFGEPYLSRSDILNLDSEIVSHNAKRRPPREPVFEFMNLDFHWDEIEEIRK